MASAWQTLEEGALTLGMSSRTLHRRIEKGLVQTRLQNGRREVLVEIPDPPLPSPSLTTSDTPSASDRQTTVSMLPTGSELSDGVGQTMLALSEDRIRRTDLAIMAYQQSVTVVAADARRTRTSARVAWSMTASMVLALFLVGLWATHRLTQAQADVMQAKAQLDHLAVQVESLSGTADKSVQEASRLRDEAQAAKIAEARAVGELAATRANLTAHLDTRATSQSPTTHPATRPWALSQRLADLLSPLPK